MLLTPGASVITVRLDDRAEVDLSAEAALDLARKALFLVASPLVYATGWRIRSMTSGSWCSIFAAGPGTVRLTVGTGKGTDASETVHEIVGGGHLANELHAAVLAAHAASTPPE